MPFSTTKIDGVLTLTLDTPGAPVNIFNRATARQALEILGGVGPRDTRAVVLRTGKPESFMNGVGLMLANAANAYDDVIRSSQELRDAFVAFRDCAVPTIAIVQGTCWGCGVELMLNTHHRLAADTFETHFYMTELKEYLFIPLFRSTRNLPEAVGLSDAIELLLWGERWSARQAAQRGLVNECAGPEGFEAAVASFVERVLRGEVASCRRSRDAAWRAANAFADDDACSRALGRIKALPSAYQRVYLDALDLLQDAARRDVGDEHRLRELARCSDSTICTLGKSAYAFFYIRQTAAALVQQRGLDVATPRSLTFERVAVEDETSAYSAFYSTLRARRLPGVSVDVEGNDPPVDEAASRVMIASAGSTRRDAPDEVVVEAVCEFSRRVPRRGLVLYRPVDSSGSSFLELVERERGAGAPLARLLARWGFHVATSAPGREFASNRLLRGFFAPLVGAVLEGVRVEVIGRALRGFGFVAQPGDLLRGLPRRELAACVRPATTGSPSLSDVDGALDALAGAPPVTDGSPHPEVIDALTISLAAAAWQDLDGATGDAGGNGRFRHPALVDLAARELLDFPLSARSLCRYLSRDRVAAAQTARSRFLTDEARAAADAYASSARDFYRG
jgi:enoyl-CoA hydratase/carnithine racemase